MINERRRRTCLFALGSTLAGVAVVTGWQPAALAAATPTAGQVLAFGDNSKGELGQGGAVDTDAHATPATVALPTSAGPIVASAVGSLFSVLVDANGVVYTFGNNADGEQGAGSSSTTPVTTPTVLAFPGVVGKITTVAAGAYSGLAMTSSGQVFGWGYNGDGQLGNATNSFQKPNLINLGTGSGTATGIAVGQEQSLVSTSTGAVYGFGDNSCGELGVAATSGTSDNPTPTKVALPTGVFATGVASGQESSYVTTRSGAVYSFGYNGTGELGRAPVGSSTCEAQPGIFALPTGVSGLSATAGNSHALVLGSDGKVYASGSNAYGQLGLGSNGSQVTTPTVVPLPSATQKPLTIAATEFTSYVLTTDGTLYSFGDGGKGELGDTTTNDNQRTPTTVVAPTGTTFESIATGNEADHALAVVSDLRVATASFASGQVGTSYPPTTLVATGGVAPFTWAASGLPAGLSVSPAGGLSGTPTAAGTTTVTLTVTDANGILSSTSLPFTVNAAPVTPSPTPTPVVAPPVTTPPVISPPVVASPGTVKTPSAASVIGALVATLVPRNKSATFAVLAKKGYAQSVSVLETGKLAVTWTFQPRHGKKVTVATGTATFTRTGLSHLTVKLTRAGTALLKAGQKVGLTFTAAFTHGTQKLAGKKTGTLR